MKGKNTMKLNTATMMEAVQLWLESQFAEGNCPVVTSVRASGGVDYTFEITTNSPDKAADDD